MLGRAFGSLVGNWPVALRSLAAGWGGPGIVVLAAGGYPYAAIATAVLAWATLARLDGVGEEPAPELASRR